MNDFNKLMGQTVSFLEAGQTRQGTVFAFEVYTDRDGDPYAVLCVMDAAGKSRLVQDRDVVFSAYVVPTPPTPTE